LLFAIAAACGAPAAPTTPTTSTTTPSAATGAAAAGSANAARIARIERGLPPPVVIRGEDRNRALIDRMRELKIPAVAIAVFDHYELQWTKAYGLADAEARTPATDDTVFLAGSISKSVNALAALQAAADGTLSLTAPINAALTSWKLPDNDLTRATPVTLRHLLSHTAGTTVHGFPGYAPGAAVPTLVQILDGASPANTPEIRVDLAPGTKFRYSGGGTTIVQLALTERTRRPYPDLLRDRVLAPLGMSHSTFVQQPPPATAAVGYKPDGSPVVGKRHAYPEMAAAGLWTTPGDLARFFLEVARARAGRSSLISRELATQMTTPVIEAGPGQSVGLGVFLFDRNGTKLFGHNGADEGFQADATASLDGGFGVVVMASSENGFQIFGEIERAVFAEYGWPGREEPAVRVAIDPAPFVGGYAMGGGAVVAAQGARLELRRPYGDPIELVPIAADTVVAIDDGVRYRLVDGGRALEAKHPLGPVRMVPRLADGERLPLLELKAGRFDDAVAAWKERERANPKDPTINDDEVNLLGYRLMGGGKLDDAIAVLRLVATVHPDSANAHDSLGEAYMTAGDKPRAIAEYEATLATLDKDPRVGPGQKPRFRKHAEEQLAKLRAPAPAPAPTR
jgi:CubicO group peptidase (beta-lactamase class C family)